MSERAVEYLTKGIESFIDRCRQEWDVSYAEVLGCLELVKTNIAIEALEDEE